MTKTYSIQTEETYNTPKQAASRKKELQTIYPFVRIQKIPINHKRKIYLFKVKCYILILND